jgi:hypothetical protein
MTFLQAVARAWDPRHAERRSREAPWR